MIYLLDGSNILGVLGMDRESAESQRGLVRMAASVARARGGKVSCYFDGPPRPHFATSIGAVAVRFSAPRSADDLIVDQVRKERQPVVVVSADGELASRVAGRNIRIMKPREFAALVPESLETRTIGPGEDWESYFSDPKNRNV